MLKKNKPKKQQPFLLGLIFLLENVCWRRVNVLTLLHPQHGLLTLNDHAGEKPFIIYGITESKASVIQWESSYHSVV